MTLDSVSSCLSKSIAPSFFCTIKFSFSTDFKYTNIDKLKVKEQKKAYLEDILKKRLK